MNHDIDLEKYHIRTDLVIETIETATEKLIDLKTFHKQYEDIKVTTIDISKEQEVRLKKKEGRYITIEFLDVTDHTNKEKVTKVFKDALLDLLKHLKIGPKATCLIIGLGNLGSTPDALGPKVAQKVLVTKHLLSLTGELEAGFREVSAFSPGVMGSTGIETSKIILGVIKETKPDWILIIDALAAGSVTRLNKTIQMTDTGINPGSGVGNKREAISKEKVGVPVIAIGIPTVVDAVTIVSETINYIFKHVSYQKEHLNRPLNKLVIPGTLNYIKENKPLTDLNKKEKTNLLGIMGNLTEDQLKNLIYEVLTPIGYNLMVTPKEIDFVIEKLSDVLTKGINEALHYKIS